MIPRWSSSSLFLRTFLLLVVVLLACLAAWDFTLRIIHISSEAQVHAHELSDVMKLSGALIEQSEYRSVIRLGVPDGHSEILPRLPTDSVVPLGNTYYEKELALALETTLHANRDTFMREVNGRPGIWLPLTASGRDYWLRTPLPPASTWPSAIFWIAWILACILLALLGAWAISRFIHRPLKRLQFAASRFRAGHFEDSPLDEEAVPEELREVNAGFNRMARQIGQTRQNNAIMLAGISHDLRTPLARLRLELELSVPSPEARKGMATDVEQIDSIIDKFLVYAQSLASDASSPKLTPVLLLAALARESSAFEGRPDLRIKYHSIPARSYVRADPVELGRVFSNIFENARRYGKTPETGIAEVEVTAQRTQGRWRILIRDHGVGVSREHLPLLVQPFFRGDAARTAATGTGLGLAIVERMIQRMNGTLRLELPADGGLQVIIDLPVAHTPR